MHNGARSETHRKAVCGGVVRDYGGGFSSAYPANLGDCSMLQAELWPILYGVRFAWARGLHNLVIESDSKLAIELITKGCPLRHPCHALVQQI